MSAIKTDQELREQFFKIYRKHATNENQMFNEDWLNDICDEFLETISKTIEKQKKEIEHVNKKLEHLESFTGVHISDSFSFSGCELVDRIKAKNADIEKLKFMIENGLSWEDLKTDGAIGD